MLSTLFLKKPFDKVLLHFKLCEPSGIQKNKLQLDIMSCCDNGDNDSWYEI